MKQSEAKERIRSIWMSQSDRCNKNITYPVSFYALIEVNHPDLLQFQYSGTKYQLIKTWLEEWQRSFC